MLFSPLCSGSSGNSSYLEAGGVRLLVDAGLPGKRMEQLLDMIDVSARSLDAILVTHEHSDHVSGVGVLSRKYDIPVYAAEACWRAADEIFAIFVTTSTACFVASTWAWVIFAISCEV